MRLNSQKIEKKGQTSQKIAEFDKGDPRFQHAHFLIEYGGTPGLFAGCLAICCICWIKAASAV